MASEPPARLHLRNRRKALGLSLRGLAQKTGLSAAHLSDCENGRRMPSRGAVRKWAQALKTSVRLCTDLYAQQVGRDATRKWLEAE